ncbi:VWA domain-containing protein [Aquincola sp. S2]|uniref:VWA domain-containing protein n=1 Tax=Pseudaquabacterium terrae TaxID=2732868 RepID=A0ABX2ELM8_9BURK|nr:VWA domain-containing protein [Aquabacterium terrae]NRF69475.1 VWA domain-containing protein [Aquabacterium terrae]
MLIAQKTPGHLAENVMHFARVLRAAGLAVGTDRVQLALQALQVAGFERKRDFHAVLSACLLDRIEHRELFDQAFVLFWRDPDLLGRMRALLLPTVRAKDGAPPAPENRRLGDALFPHQPPTPPAEAQDEQIELDATLTWNDRELLQKADFDTMSSEEWRQARRLLTDLPLMFEQLPTRRSRPAAPPGRPDWRATLQAMARHGGELWDMRWRRQRLRPAPLTVLADISGSMSRYSRMLLHFAHALGHAEARVESFVFGTRLTRTTRLLKRRDPDLAIAQVVHAVEDWSGGTRITTSLQEFNRRWARRVLSSRATVLLISDGLEHGDTRALSFEMERLHKSCRRLIWLNPLLRFERFEPRAGGIKAMLPHVDRFLPAHNLQSLAELVQVLRQMDTPPRRPH